MVDEKFDGEEFDIEEFIELGDVVYLNSDKMHTMTVNSDKDSDGNVRCLWFDHYDLKSGVFNVQSLTKVVVDKD